MGQLLGDAVGNTGDNHAAVAPSNEDDVCEILERDQVHNVLDVRFEVHIRPRNMCAVAKTGEAIGLQTATACLSGLLPQMFCESRRPGCRNIACRGLSSFSHSGSFLGSQSHVTMPSVSVISPPAPTAMCKPVRKASLACAVASGVTPA